MTYALNEEAHMVLGKCEINEKVKYHVRSASYGMAFILMYIFLNIGILINKAISVIDYLKLIR